MSEQDSNSSSNWNPWEVLGGAVFVVVVAALIILANHHWTFVGVF